MQFVVTAPPGRGTGLNRAGGGCAWATRADSTRGIRWAQSQRLPVGAGYVLEIRWSAQWQDALPVRGGQVPKGRFELLVYDFFIFGEAACLKKYQQVCRGEKTHSTISNIFGPNQLGARGPISLQARLREGHAAPERIRPSLGFISVLEQSTGGGEGWLNWGKREVIKRGDAEGKKGWYGCSLGEWGKCSL